MCGNVTRLLEAVEDAEIAARAVHGERSDTPAQDRQRRRASHFADGAAVEPIRQIGIAI